MRAIKIGLFAAAALSVSGCGDARGQHDGGSTVQRHYQVGPFQQIDVAGPYDVDVTTGGVAGVTASGPQELIDELVVEVRGSRLLIHPKEEHGFFHVFKSNIDGSAVVHVTTAAALSAASLAGSGDLKVDKVDAGGFSGNLAGSGDLTLGQASAQNLKLSIAGSGDIHAGSGQAANVEYSTAGSGNIDAGGVRAQSAHVNAVGSGSINGQATGTATVTIMGSGDVTLTGGAKCTVSKMGSGDARCS